MSPEIIKNIILVAFAALIFMAGWTVEGWRKDAEIDRMHRAYAEERTRAATQAAAELKAAVDRGNALAARVTAAESTRDIALQETQDALRKVTTGKPCLGGAAVRLLNHSVDTANMPTATSQPAGAAAAAATDSDYVSDTDIALWAAFARRSYDTCRGRIDALNEFFNQPLSSE